MTVQELRTNVLKKTMREMGEFLGITASGYYLKEVGDRKFTANEIVKICKLAGVHAEDLDLLDDILEG